MFVLYFNKITIDYKIKLLLLYIYISFRIFRKIFIRTQEINVCIKYLDNKKYKIYLPVKFYLYYILNFYNYYNFDI